MQPGALLRTRTPTHLHHQLSACAQGRLRAWAQCECQTAIAPQAPVNVFPDAEDVVDVVGAESKPRLSCTDNALDAPAALPVATASDAATPDPEYSADAAASDAQAGAAAALDAAADDGWGEGVPVPDVAAAEDVAVPAAPPGGGGGGEDDSRTAAAAAVSQEPRDAGTPGAVRRTIKGAAMTADAARRILEEPWDDALEADVELPAQWTETDDGAKCPLPGVLSVFLTGVHACTRLSCS